MNKSPFNYIGNKYQIITQLFDIFPNNINTFIDFFSGGCDVVTNIQAKEKIAIDINEYIMEILQEFQNKSLEEILNFIENRIKEFDLSKINEEGFLKYREYYNTIPEYHTPLDLYTLSRFSFHFTIRFNKEKKFNAGFGRSYSNFSARQRKSIIQFHKDIQNVKLLCINFEDFLLNDLNPQTCFLYFDPPYLITNQVYNNGLPEVWQKWTEQDECRILKYISQAHNLGFKFALSNVLYHHGNTNTILDNWIKENNFTIHDIYNPAYSHCTHTVNDGGYKTKEIVVTNY